jgi:hypothetical protein
MRTVVHFCKTGAFGIPETFRTSGNALKVRMNCIGSPNASVIRSKSGEHQNIVKGVHGMRFWSVAEALLPMGVLVSPISPALASTFSTIDVLGAAITQAFGINARGAIFAGDNEAGERGDIPKRKETLLKGETARRRLRHPHVLRRCLTATPAAENPIAIPKSQLPLFQEIFESFFLDRQLSYVIL